MKARAPSPPNSSSSECIGQPYTTYAMVPPAANGACEQPLLWTTTVYWGFNIWEWYLRIHFNLPWNSGWGLGELLRIHFNLPWNSGWGLGLIEGNHPHHMVRVKRGRSYCFLHCDPFERVLTALFILHTFNCCQPSSGVKKCSTYDSAQCNACTGCSLMTEKCSIVLVQNCIHLHCADAQEQLAQSCCWWGGSSDCSWEEGVGGASCRGSTDYD